MHEPFSITKALSSLSSTRKIFSSEADFQFALAWHIKELYPHVEIRLEWIPVDYAPNMYIDIVVYESGKMIPIELKYKTKRTDVIADGERFVLKNQGAQDIGRYDFLKDISRLEFLRQRIGNFDSGYAIFLTNDASYFGQPRHEAVNHFAFSMANDSIKTGVLAWGANTGSGTMKNRNQPIELQDEYRLYWSEYSHINDAEKVWQLVVPVASKTSI